MATNQEVIDRFVQSVGELPRPLRSDSLRFENGQLFSYRTLIAEWTLTRHVITTTQKYSPTTSRQMRQLAVALTAAGYEPDTTYGRTQKQVHNPGRWNGVGPAWGPEYSMVDFSAWHGPHSWPDQPLEEGTEDVR